MKIFSSLKLIFVNFRTKRIIITLLLFLIKISVTLNQTCGIKEPKSFDECISDSSTNSICCYARIKSSTKDSTLCIFVPKSQIFITPHIRSLDIGSQEEFIDIFLECGFKPDNISYGNPYSLCGDNPKEPYDCINNSTKNASCCYIKNPNGESFCVLNNGIYNNNKSFFGVKIICQGNFLYINILILFCIIFF